ncbi:MAG: prepilin-type N-terminal cleavage/methylation domain-containing protein [Bacillota bacterium]|nr:prepilin-type N-terminal cleavage/methylation domain-containing protein [Bacillota bacterium]
MNKKGFTLIELMIALSIFIIISGYIYKTFFNQIRQSVGFNNNVDLQYNVNKALGLMSDKLRSSGTVTLSGSPVGQVISSGKVVIDLTSNSSNPDIYYNASSKQLIDKNGNQCLYISSIVISQGALSNNENELIFITVSGIEANTQFSSSTAVNIKR